MSPEEKFKLFAESSTASIITLNEQKLPCSQASGVYAELDKNELCLISCGHGVRMDQKYYIETGKQVNGGTIALDIISSVYAVYTPDQLGPDISILKIDKNKAAKIGKTNSKIADIELAVFDINKIGSVVTGDERYGFSKIKGFQLDKFINPIEWIKKQVTEIDMVLESETDWFYTFKLSGDHKGAEFYRGCSGSPIMEATRQLCSIVIGGDEKTNTIIGLKLKKVIDDYKIKEMLRILK